MKAISCPATSISSAAGRAVRKETSAPITISQDHEEAATPRAATFLAANLGFLAASEQLAQRRSALLCQEDHGLDAMQSKLNYLLPAGQTVSGYLQGRRSRGLPFYRRKSQQYRRLAEADQERSQLTTQDRFEAHDLDSRLLQDLRQQLQNYPIVRAELVKKTLRFFPEQPLYVLLVSPHDPDNNPETPAAWPQLEPTLETQIAQELCFQRELLVCLIERTEPPLVARIQAVSLGNLLG